MTRASRDKHTPNDTFGAYRLVSRIATTKSCEVWEAEHIKYRRRHALKIMLPSLSGDRSQIGYLKHEFTTGQQLQHESVIRTDDYGTDDGLAYVVMEHFPAPNLKQWMHETDVEASQLALQIVRSAAAALAYMHEQRWIHRDVKPDNFLIGDQGNVKLIDFTLARKPGGGLLKKILGNRSKAQGTLSYMSPEQIRNASQDHRADIYSFGCVIYELACGKPPYAAGSPNELLTKHLRSPVPSAKAANSNVTGSFSNLIRRLLAKQPADRPDSMNEVIRQMEAIQVFDR